MWRSPRARWWTATGAIVFAVAALVCAIYATRPQSCRDYECGWLQGLMPEEFRPDVAGFIIDQWTRPPDGGEPGILLRELWPGALDSEKTAAVVYALGSGAIAGCARRELAPPKDDNPRSAAGVIAADLWYPRNEAGFARNRLVVRAVDIALIDVRAAADIRVTYDFDRDGWVVSMLDEDELGTDDRWAEVAFVDAWALEEADSVDGTDKAPDRYMAKGRETIDRMRDLAHEWSRANGEFLTSPDGLADMLFAFHCAATALKYADRDGAKGDPDADRAKLDFYTAMADHVRSRGAVPDPRHKREGFEPYVRPGGDNGA